MLPGMVFSTTLIIFTIVGNIDTYKNESKIFSDIFMHAVALIWAVFMAVFFLVAIHSADSATKAVSFTFCLMNTRKKFRI
jgi:hypothetical protein